MSDLTEKRADTPWERLTNGIIRENPTFVLMLGMCPTLAVTTSAINGLGMGLATTAVLMMSNLIISLLRKVIPSRVRIPAFIVIIATFVTVVQLLLEAYLPALNDALGMYISLIVVNCIILGRAESYAYSHPPIPSYFDGLGMGLGFSLALTCIGAVRELLGAGKLFGQAVLPASYTPISIFILAPGAFFVLAALSALQNFIKLQAAKAGKPKRELPAGCAHDCAGCGIAGCSTRFYDASAKSGKTESIGTESGRIESERTKSGRTESEGTKSGRTGKDRAVSAILSDEKEKKGQGTVKNGTDKGSVGEPAGPESVRKDPVSLSQGKEEA